MVYVVHVWTDSWRDTRWEGRGGREKNEKPEERESEGEGREPLFPLPPIPLPVSRVGEGAYFIRRPSEGGMTDKNPFCCHAASFYCAARRKSRNKIDD